MAEQSFNEAEQYLLQHWAETVEIEDSIGEIREKYQTLCHRVVETVRANHEELDRDIVEVRRISGTAVKSGVIVLSKASWPADGKRPTGIWIENLRLEILTDEEEPPPSVGLWIQENKDWDCVAVERSVREAASKTMSSEQRARWQQGDNEDSPLFGRAVASKVEILEMIAKGDADRFIALLAEQFDDLALLIPAIDSAVGTKPKSE